MRRTTRGNLALFITHPGLPILIALAAAGLATALARDAAKEPKLFVRATDILELAGSLGSNAASSDSFQRISNVAFDDPPFDRQDMVAFEENRSFVYACGDTSRSADSRNSIPGIGSTARLLRRFIFLKPSTFVIDDEVQTNGSNKPIHWSLYGRRKPEIVSSSAKFTEGEEELFCETLLPKKVVAGQGVSQSGAGREAEEYVVTAAAQGNFPTVRFLHVLQARRHGDESSKVRSELVTENGQLCLKLSAVDKVFQLTLPPAQAGAGDIAISNVGRKALIERRPLPSGILPHGVEGVQLLEQWDADYRRKNPPLWDAGLPSRELRKVVEDGTIRACRVVELGCGSGTDAIYLAGKGFDVTAIDIAPTALAQAQEKARKAGVQVRWLLADVLARPKLEPFDFIYDRGCYHEVRGQNLAAYIETVRRYSRAKTRFLLLAGSINETVLDFGPPRVAEEEIRDDFSSLFDFEWVRESRFEIAKPGAMGPLAWSVLMRRKPSVGLDK
jgi:methyl halide transferase